MQGLLPDTTAVGPYFYSSSRPHTCLLCVQALTAGSPKVLAASKLAVEEAKQVLEVHGASWADMWKQQTQHVWTASDRQATPVCRS